MSILNINYMISVYYLELADYINDHHVLHVDSIYDRHFLPFERADLTKYASLRPGLGWVGLNS